VLLLFALAASNRPRKPAYAEEAARGLAQLPHLRLRHQRGGGVSRRSYLSTSSWKGCENIFGPDPELPTGGADPLRMERRSTCGRHHPERTTSLGLFCIRRPRQRPFRRMAARSTVHPSFETPPSAAPQDQVEYASPSPPTPFEAVAAPKFRSNIGTRWPEERTDVFAGVKQS
jgi:hypothetical protein